MKFGLLADIHEEVESLIRAIAALRQRGAEQFILLGDVFEHGRRLREVISNLSPLHALAVWGNHDFGLRSEYNPGIREEFDPEVIAFFDSLLPRITLDNCCFQHITHHLDPHDFYDLWIGEESGQNPDLAFQTRPERLLVMGHLHRWAAIRPSGPVDWDGRSVLRLLPDERYLLVIHGVQQGFCALLDTVENWLEPIQSSEFANL
jgi:predicted MPP superfamily phosphohydrolase